MIGKKEWFTRRKYSGWGLTPKTWQGFLYVGLIVFLGFSLNRLPLQNNLKLVLSVILIVVFLADLLIIMASIKLDEREAKIEAIAERNASWSMVSTIAVLIIYFSMNELSFSSQEIMPFIVLPMVTGLLAKALSNLFLHNKEL